MREEGVPPGPPLQPGSPLADVDITGIMAMIPHRYPFLLIDRVTGLEAFRRATGLKNVTISEPFFAGHFPGHPIMPGVLVIEAMAQAATVLAIASLGPAVRGSPVYFMTVENGRFRKPIFPGDQLRLEIEVHRNRLGVWKFGGKATVDGVLAAEAEFGAKILRG
jgi:3-hydroxyacyl-[acyl-carrier-protein] dehydratase